MAQGLAGVEQPRRCVTQHGVCGGRWRSVTRLYLNGKIGQHLYFGSLWICPGFQKLMHWHPGRSVMCCEYYILSLSSKTSMTDINTVTPI